MGKKDKPHRGTKKAAGTLIPLIVRFAKPSHKRAIQRAAEKAGVSASKFLIEAGLEKAAQHRTNGNGEAA